MRFRPLIAVALILGLAAASPARAEDDRMVGRMDRAKPKSERTAQAEADDADERPAYSDFSGADDRTAGPIPVDKPGRESTDEAPRKSNRTAETESESGRESDNRTTASPVAPAHGNEPPKEYTVDLGPQPIDPEETRPVEASLPPVKSIPIDELEAYGLYDTAAAESLGIDMWIGSGRGNIIEKLPQIPPATRYRTMRVLTERMLLTHTDPDMIGGGSSAPGEDLMTLRLEKLIQTGAYDDAANLYALNPGRPYHERLARAGVTAMLHSGQSALGCLETKALLSSYKDVSFWQQLSAICDIFLTNDLTKNQQITVPTHVFENSAILQKLVDKPGFLFKPDNVEELAALSPAERLAVFTLKRLDYDKLERLSFNELVKAEPALLSAMLADSALPPRLRMYASLAAISLGAADVSTLATFYESGNIGGDSKGAKSWKQLVTLYRTAKVQSTGSQRDSLLVQALNLRKTYGTAALLPFAPMLAEADPGNMTPESIGAALAVMVKAGQDIPEKWRSLGLAVLSPEQKATDATLSFVAYDISQGFKPLRSLEPTEFEGILKNMTPETARIVKIIYEKLDKNSKLHNIGADGAYEKDPVLTPPVDYVMPLSSLLNELELAEKDKRLGEVILISSILLRSTPPGKIAPEVLGEVLDGYKTVGLTREARELSAEVVLGLRK
jgi:hypothetical protein